MVDHSLIIQYVPQFGVGLRSSEYQRIQSGRAKAGPKKAVCRTWVLFFKVTLSNSHGS